MRYENRIVAFVDILGISDQLRNPLHSERIARAVHGVLSSLSRKDSVFLELAHVRTGSLACVQFDGPFAPKDRMSNLSDAIVMSFAEKETANPFAMGSRLIPLLRCLSSVFWLQRGLLTVGLRTRGGIARGRLSHTRSLVIGDALVHAHDLECGVAIYPRAVISDDLIAMAMSEPVPDEIALVRNRLAHLIRVDSDGKHFVDYLGYDPIGGYFYLQDHIVSILREVENDLVGESDERIRQKLEWLRSYVWSSALCMAHLDNRLGVNTGTMFGSAFERSTENFLEYVRALEAENA